MAKNVWYIAKAINAAKSGGYRALKDIADIIGDAAQLAAPKDTEELANSMLVNGNYGSLEVSISFDTGNRYGIRQHEDLSLNHPHGGQAKYLEAPFYELGASLLNQAIADEIRKELG